MIFFKMGKNIKHRKFDYIPRFYDEQKEELEKRLKRYDTTISDPELAKERIKGGFRKKYRAKDNYSSKTQKRSNMILMATVVILLLLTTIFLVEYLPRIIASFE